MKNVKFLPGITRLLVVVFFVSIFFSLKDADAAFDIRVRPYEGGYNLNYNNVDLQAGRVNKELVVDITSDINKQYRLMQILAEPLTNDQGISMPQESFLVNGIRGSNKYGNLGVETDTPVFLGRSVIYTSNQNGLSDSFVLVYGLIVPQNQEPGYYRGRVQFILEPIDSTQESKIVVLDIAAQIEAQSKVEIVTSSQDGIVRLDASNPDKMISDVGINIKGGLGRQFKIIQSLPDALVSSEGDELKPEAVKFIVREAREGVALNQETPLSLKSQVIYTSGPRGQADGFVVTYSLDDLSGQKAGTYLGNIRYMLEGEGLAASGLLDTIRIEVNNPRVFDIAITPQMGGRIEFRDLKPSQPAKTYEVQVKISSNLGKRYQVSQTVNSGLVNKEGYEIADSYFTCRSEALDSTKGSVKTAQNAPVSKQTGNTLFISDDKGSGDAFKVVYELTPPPDVRSGDYSTTLVYSLLEI